MQALLYGVVAGSYLLALRRPVWTLVAVVVVELALVGYVPGTPVSIRLATALASVFVAAPIVFYVVQFWDGRLRAVLLPTLVFVGTAIAVNLLYSDIGYVLKYFRWQLGQVVALVLAVAVIRERRDLALVATVGLVLGTISGILALWQHYSPTTALYGAATAADVIAAQGRAVGLIRSPVLLANALAFILLPVLGLLLSGPLRFDLTRMLLGLSALFLSAGLYVTFTRSALVAAGLGLLAMAPGLGGSRRLAVVGAVLAAPILYVSLEGSGLIGERYYKDVSNDSSAASHLALLEVGAAVALDNWLIGIGHEWFEEESAQYADVVSGAAAAAATERVGEARVHNDFLNVWFSWGIVALGAYLAVFVGSIVNYVAAIRGSDWLIRGLSLGCIGGVVAYAVNSAFHNYLDSSAVLWLYGGLSVSLARLASAEGSDRRLRLARLRTLARNRDDTLQQIADRSSPTARTALTR